MEKKILDVTCGARSIWFNKHHPSAIYCDRRREEHHIKTPNGGTKNIIVEPDVQCDFTHLPFDDNAFQLVGLGPAAFAPCWEWASWYSIWEVRGGLAQNAPRWFPRVYASSKA